MHLSIQHGFHSRKGKELAFPEGPLTILIFILIFSTPLMAFEVEICSNSTDCEGSFWIPPYIVCENRTCKCASNMCVYQATGDSGITYYYCGECGELGSNCTPVNNTCRDPATCYGGKCICKFGYIAKDVCVLIESVTNFKRSLILIGILFSILFINRLVIWHKTLNRLFYRIVRCGRGGYDIDETVVGYNPDSAEKSAAYTISSRDFMVATSDPDLAWAMHLSSQENANDSYWNENEEAQDGRARSGSRRGIGNIRSIRRELNGFDRESSSRSSTSSTFTVRSTTDSSIFSSYSSFDSTSFRSIRRGTSGNIGRNKRSNYYSLLNETESSGDSGEIILTRILDHRQSSSPSDVQASITHDTRFPTGARPKERNENKSLGTTDNETYSTYDDSNTIPLCNRFNSSGDSSSNYSSAISTLSRESFRSTNSNTSSEEIKTLRSNSVLATSSLVNLVKQKRARSLEPVSSTLRASPSEGNRGLISKEFNEENDSNAKL